VTVPPEDGGDTGGTAGHVLIFIILTDPRITIMDLHIHTPIVPIIRHHIIGTIITVGKPLRFDLTLNQVLGSTFWSEHCMSSKLIIKGEDYDKNDFSYVLFNDLFIFRVTSHSM